MGIVKEITPQAIITNIEGTQIMIEEQFDSLLAIDIQSSEQDKKDSKRNQQLVSSDFYID